MGSISACRKPPHAKTFGMEVECYPNEIPNQQFLGFWEKTHDASLGFGGYEFVSQPMPFDMLINQVNKLHHRVAGWKVADDCGLHIHVSRKMWSDRRRKEFDDFLYYEASTIDVTRWFGRHSCRYAPLCEACDGLEDKFRAINLCHPHTYEFRVWKAGDVAWTIEALRRTRAIVLYQGKYTVEWMNKLCANNVGVPTPTLGEVLRSAVEMPAVRRVRRVNNV